MQIQVKCGCGEIECQEWAIIELQGVVESQPSVGNNLAGLEIGRLCCSHSSSYTLTIGYHELSGVKSAIKKPLVVLRKKKKEAGAVEIEVTGVIKHRILFRNRPKAIISKPGKSTAAG